MEESLYFLVLNLVWRDIINNYKESHRDKNLNQDYFNKIDSQEKAYWLGFLYADGCLCNGSIILALKRSDKRHLIKFKETINSKNASVHDRKCIVKNKEHLFSSFAVKNEKLYTDLIKHGCIPQKTFTLKPPSIDVSLEKHFIRGYIDGDGFIGINKRKQYVFEVCGNNDVVDWISMFLEKNLNKKFRVYKHHNVFRIAKEGNILVPNICKLLYRDCNIALKRKLKIANEAISYLNKRESNYLASGGHFIVPCPKFEII